MDFDLFLYNKARVLIKFKVVGLLASPHFQKCRFYVEKMHACFPLEYDKPEIRAMLNLDWDEYLKKMRRRYANTSQKSYYLLHVPVAVYIDGTFIGDDEDLYKYISKKYHIDTNLDFLKIAQDELIKYFLDIIDKHKRKFAYLTVAIDQHVAGTMLFMLYNDLVPITCNNFLSRCVNPDSGYKGTKVHRIARYSWIQCGGFKLNHEHMPCENYSVPHNRRGVLSMCNERRHHNNSTQFYITLEPADWMDYNYVAFGQLIQGAEVLNMIEQVATYYQKPLRKIEITNCGEFSLCPQIDEEYAKALNPPYESLFVHEPGTYDVDVDSVLSLTGLRSGKYYLRTDLPLRPHDYLNQINEQETEMEVEQETVLQKVEVQIEDVEAGPVISRAQSLQLIDSDTQKQLFNSKTFYFRGDHVII